MTFLSKNIAFFVIVISVIATADSALATIIDNPGPNATIDNPGPPTTPVPELSDYLAMAFVAITGGYLVYRTNKRKRTSL